MSNYDEIIQKLGWGRYQKINMILGHILLGIMALHTLSTIFLAYPMPYACDPEMRELLEEVCNVSSFRNHTHSFIPRKDENTPDHCLQYSLNLSRNERSELCLSWKDEQAFNLSKEVKACSKHIFTSDGTVETSVSEDFDMVCDKAWYNYFLQSAYMTGVFLNGLVFGKLADRFGRRKVLLFMNIATVASGYLLVFATSFAVFAFLRTLIGFVCFVAPVTNVLATETTRVDQRSTMVQIIACGYSVGMIVLVGIGYFVRQWITFEIVVASSYLLGVFISWYLDESPRWLATKGKIDEANCILQKIAEINKKSVTLLGQTCENDEDKSNNKNLNLHDDNSKVENTVLVSGKASKNPGMVDTLRTPQLRKLTLVVAYSWFASSCAFYGLTLNVANVGGNIYLNTLIMGAVIIPVYPPVIYLSNKVGRRTLISWSFILTGLFCTSMYFIPKEIHALHVTMFLTGRTFTLVTFNTLYLFSVEVYPTVIRSTALNFASACARLGAIVAPGIAMTGIFHSTLPYTSFGLISLIAGILFQLLPETNKMQMSDSLAEAEIFMSQHPGPIEKLLCNKNPLSSSEQE